MGPDVSVQWWQLGSKVTVTCSCGETRLRYLPCLQPPLVPAAFRVVLCPVDSGRWP